MTAASDANWEALQQAFGDEFTNPFGSVRISEVFVHRFRFNPYTRFGVFVHPGDRRA